MEMYGIGVPIIRTIIFWGPYWGTLILKNYHMGTDCLRLLWSWASCSSRFRILGLRLRVYCTGLSL